MRIVLFVVLACLFACASAAAPLVRSSDVEPAAASETLATRTLTNIVATKSGLVQGVVQNGAKVFYAIPFAAPPVGQLRWKAPQQAAKWTGVRAPTTYAPSCPQQVLPGYVINEDCLYLNVFVPAGATANSRLPVRVWFYGGNYVGGRTDEFPADLLAVQANSIVVTVSYRVNIFGFFTIPGLVNESPVLNYGLQDQQRALRWVKKNIGAFGGDCNNVMLFGQSAGASSVGMHLIMENSWRLFNEAVMESPGPWFFPSLPTATFLCQSLAGTIPTCSSSLPAAQYLACLRGLPADDLLNAYLLNSLAYGYCTSPVIDGQQIKDAPGKLFADGKIKPNVPLIIGSNSEEGNYLGFLYLVGGLNRTELTLNEYEYDFLTSVIIPPQYYTTVLDWYAPLAAASGYWAAFSKLVGDFFINAGTCIVANGAAKSSNSVYRYVFTQETTNSDYSFLGPTHGSEQPYVFNNPLVFQANSFTPSEQTLANRIVSYWTKFHQSGDPNKSGLPDWPRYKVNSKRAAVLNVTPSTVLNYNEPWCSVWKPLLLAAL